MCVCREREREDIKKRTFIYLYFIDLKLKKIQKNKKMVEYHLDCKYNLFKN